MTTILILGGYGFTGRLLARHLLEQSEAKLRLGGRNIAKAQALADQLNAQFPGRSISAIRVEPVEVDASDLNSLLRALQGVDFLVVAAPTTQYAGTVVRAALDCGVDYLDVQLDANKFTLLKSHAAEIQRAGRCFITEAGFHPGLPAALARFAALHFDRMDSALIAGYLNMGGSLPYSEAVDELMEAFRNYQGQILRDGKWTKPNSVDVRLVDFGSLPNSKAEIGRRKCFSMFLEELRDLPKAIPTLKELGFYMAGFHWFVDWVLTPIAMAGVKIAPRLAKRPLGKLVWWGMQTFPKPPYCVMLKVEASGEKNGQPYNFEMTVSHTDGYELTAIPVVACLLQYLDGSIRRPGLWMMGHLVEPRRLLADMERMGVQVTVGRTH